jgi:hypothetical protein
LGCPPTNPPKGKLHDYSGENVEKFSCEQKLQSNFAVHEGFAVMVKFAFMINRRQGDPRAVENAFKAVEKLSVYE